MISVALFGTFAGVTCARADINGPKHGLLPSSVSVSALVPHQETSSTPVDPVGPLSGSLHGVVRDHRWTLGPCFSAWSGWATWGLGLRFNIEVSRSFPHTLAPGEAARRHRQTVSVGTLAAVALVPLRPPGSVEERLLYHPLGPQSFRHTSSFARRREHPFYRLARPHLGQDYGIAAGCGVYAAHGGEVGFRKGALVITEVASRYRVPGRLQSRYRHIRPLEDLRAGLMVQAGDLIGWVNTRERGTTGPHLHFEILRWAPDLPSGWSGTAWGAHMRLGSGWAHMDPALLVYTTDYAGIRDYANRTTVAVDHRQQADETDGAE